MSKAYRPTGLNGTPMTELWDVTCHMGLKFYAWFEPLPDTSERAPPKLQPTGGISAVTGHFGHKTLRHQDTLGHFGTDLKTLQHQKRGTRHFDTSAVIEEKPGHFDPRQFQWDTAPPVIRLKLQHQFILWCRSVLRPKCPAPISAILDLSTPRGIEGWVELVIMSNSLSRP